MAEVSKRFVQILDNKVLEIGRGYITPSEAVKALKAYGLINDSTEFIELLESGQIPHAYQTLNTQKWWRIPLSHPDAKYKSVNQGSNSLWTTGVYDTYSSSTSFWGDLDSPENKLRQKRGCLLTIFLVVFLPLMVGYCNSDAYNEDGTPKKVQNSAWDGSVQQVVSYLKKEYLIDPLSYQPIEWSPVQQVNDGYWVRHQYRARNSFGGYVVMDQVFHLNMDGKVDRVQDYIK